MPTEDYTLPPPQLGKVHDVLLPVGGGLIAIVALGLFVDLLRNPANHDGWELPLSWAAVVGLGLVSWWAWRQIKRRMAAVDALGPQTKQLEALARHWSSVSIPVRHR